MRNIRRKLTCLLGAGLVAFATACSASGGSVQVSQPTKPPGLSISASSCTLTTSTNSFTQKKYRHMKGKLSFGNTSGKRDVYSYRVTFKRGGTQVGWAEQQQIVEKGSATETFDTGESNSHWSVDITAYTDGALDCSATFVAP